MSLVTIGVPVYNADALLVRALENLRTQSFTDFKVVILDNASTDLTAQIARDFARLDPRFVYQRQPYNKGCRQNFVDALAAADTPYFMWRAYDDFSDLNYIEELAGLLDRSPDAALAVGRTVLSKKGRDRVKMFPRRGAFEPLSIYTARLLVRARASWIYGLFRTNDLKWSLARVTEDYPHTHAFDPLTILPFVVTRRVVGTDATSFVQGFVDRDGGTQEQGILDPEMMQTLRDDFRRYCVHSLPRLVGPGVRKGVVGLALRFYVDRSYRLAKILHARWKLMLGERPHAATTKYDGALLDAASNRPSVKIAAE
jgi:hypothetical protein